MVADIVEVVEVELLVVVTPPYFRHAKRGVDRQPAHSATAYFDLHGQVRRGINCEIEVFLT